MAEKSSFMGKKIEFQGKKSSFKLFGKIEFPSKRTKKSLNPYEWIIPDIWVLPLPVAHGWFRVALQGRLLGGLMILPVPRLPWQSRSHPPESSSSIRKWQWGSWPRRRPGWSQSPEPSCQAATFPRTAQQRPYSGPQGSIYLCEERKVKIMGRLNQLRFLKFRNWEDYLVVELWLVERQLLCPIRLSGTGMVTTSNFTFSLSKVYLDHVKSTANGGHALLRRFRKRLSSCLLQSEKNDTQWSYLGCCPCLRSICCRSSVHCPHHQCHQETE